MAIVQGDRSSTVFIPQLPKTYGRLGSNFTDAIAQNYHIFTPAHGNDWCMLWGPQVWLKQKPYADYAYQYSFKEGEPGKLTLEFISLPLTMRMPMVPNYLAQLY